MEQKYIFESLEEHEYETLSKQELLQLGKTAEKFYKNVIDQLVKRICKEEQTSFSLGEQLITIKNTLFGKSSEKSNYKKKKIKDKNRFFKKVLLPSERYPDADILEKDVELEEPPSCPCCLQKMKDSGLTEDSEYLHVIPKQYVVVRQKRHKYSCQNCQGALLTAPAIPRIKVGGSYSDEMIIDVSMSKYLDLIPIERYVQMASRSGIKGLPGNTLIELTHHLANFLTTIYEKIKEEVFESHIIHADETPHKMLEGDKKSNWYFWGFSSNKGSYFEARDTRSGQVAEDLLKDSKCIFLVSDAFSGYSRAVKEANKSRQENKDPPIKNLYCNAHARRKFRQSAVNFPDETKFFLWSYRRIYRLIKLNIPSRKKLFWQKFYMESMRKKAEKIELLNSSKSSIGKAVSYFLKNYEDLVRFTEDGDLPIDNNFQERQLRSPVVGRKTWYGTHSKKGAHIASILFSIVESCKINQVNPREYLKNIVNSIHQNLKIFTPFEYSAKKSQFNEVS